ncbi:MAG: archaellin/type IV pilin N-terminal domain-containing protein [Candidatus Bathyarchaeia archaeon]|jgi:flagellin-like protein
MQLLKIEKRKGISPLIATLLLIAIAVAASVLTYSWVMSMITSQSAQAQTQVRIDSVTWASGSQFSLDVRNTGSVDATIESVSIRTNSAGSTATVDSTSAGVKLISIGQGTHLPIGPVSYTYGKSQSYVIRVTTNTGFYYEAVFTSPAS